MTRIRLYQGALGGESAGRLCKKVCVQRGIEEQQTLLNRRTLFLAVIHYGYHDLKLALIWYSNHYMN